MAPACTPPRAAVGHALVSSDEEGIAFARRYLRYMPTNFLDAPPAAPAVAPASATPITEIVPQDENKPFDMHDLIDVLLDGDSFLEIHARWAKELIVGYGRLDGRAVGIVANQPKVKGGVLFTDSSDKAARFIQTCNAFGVPLLFLADVPGFMIGTQVEREGIIRHGAKMVSAVSEATVPKISVVVRKAYGAGLYAMAGPAFDPDCCIALPSAHIAVMGPSAAINAVHFNQLQAIENEAERAARTEELRAEYAQDIDILRLASELVVDAVVQPEDLRDDLIRRFALAAGAPARVARQAQPGHSRLMPAGGATEAELLEVALEAARAAAAELLPRWRGQLTVDTKSTPTDPVTEADVNAERAIREVLSAPPPGRCDPRRGGRRDRRG